jgi:hypothetical protein
MADNEPVRNRGADLRDVTSPPKAARLSPPPARLSPERRDIARRSAITRRVYSEFMEMPGMTLTLDQAACLFNIPSVACARIFEELIDDGVLCLVGNGRYGLRKYADSR